MEKKNIKDKISMILVYFACILFYEIAYQVLIFGVTNLFSSKTIFYSLFALISSILLTYITRLLEYLKLVL